MVTKLLEMNNITKEFPGVRALDDVSIDLYPGEVHGLLGENGAGKSTLIKILAGDYSKDQGEVFVKGDNVEFHSPADSKNLGIRVIYQELVTMDSLSVAENICVGALPLKKKTKLVDWKTLNENAGKVLATMNIDINPKAIVGDLSVHEKQIVEIAKALNKEATILVMDEPTAALSEEDTESLFEIIHNLKKHGVGIIYISHRMKEIFEITDRVTVLRDGQKIGTVNTKDTTKETLISMMVGRKLEEFFPKKEIKIGEPVLEAKNLTIHKIIEDISFYVKSGEILGLFGLLGSGRMNIVRALYGIDRLNSGQILIQGKPVSIKNPQYALQHKLGFMPIDRKLEGLALGMSVAGNITMANIAELGKRWFIDKKTEQSKSDKWVKDVNIKTSSIHAAVNTLSGGNQQKIVLAKLLETGSRIFLMNEPTRGIDVGAKVDIYQMMDCLCEAGAGIIMLSSELPEILSMADRIIVIASGRINGEFTREEATQEKLLHAATI